MPLGANERGIRLGQPKLLHVAGEQLLEFLGLRKRISADLLDIGVILVVLVEALLVKTLEGREEPLHFSLAETEPAQQPSRQFQCRKKRLTLDDRDAEIHQAMHMGAIARPRIDWQVGKVLTHRLGNPK